MSTYRKRDNTLTTNNLQIIFEVFFFFFFFFFFLLFENIVDSPLNQSRNTTGIPVKNVNYLHFKRKAHTVQLR